MACPIAALGAEVDRKLDDHKEVITRGTDQLVSILAQGFDGEANEKQAKATGLLALLVGTLVIARSAGTKPKMKEILAAGYRQAQMCLASPC